MIYLISIPHQMPANLKEFADDTAILNYANGVCNDTEFESVDDAKEWLTHDLNNGIWVYTLSDYEYILSYTGHQKHKVWALADCISTALLIKDNTFTVKRLNQFKQYDT